MRPAPATYPRTGLHVQCAVRVLALVPGAGVPSAWTSPPTVSLENAPPMSPRGALPSLPFSGKCPHRDVPVRLRPGRPWLLPHLHCHTLPSATFTSRHMSPQPLAELPAFTLPRPPPYVPLLQDPVGPEDVARTLLSSCSMPVGGSPRPPDSRALGTGQQSPVRPALPSLLGTLLARVPPAESQPTATFPVLKLRPPGLHRHCLFCGTFSSLSWVCGRLAPYQLLASGY